MDLIKPLPLSLLVGLAPLAHSQKLIHTHIGDAAQLNLGGEVRAAGDVNGDGTADYVLGIPERNDVSQDFGEVRVHSGLTGQVLRSWTGLAGGERLGESVVGVGDVNADGFGDVLAGAIGAGSGGEVRLYSGADGTLLRMHASEGPNDEFGVDVDAAGDLDLDGVTDYVVGAARARSMGNIRAGAIYAYSGATGAQLLFRGGVSSGDRFGSSVRAAGDVNGDGRSDFVVGAPDNDDNGSRSGAVEMISGLTGTTIWRRIGLASTDEFGEPLDGAGADMSGDGVPDVVVGTARADYVFVLSGATGNTIRLHTGAGTGGNSPAYGRGVCALPDVDGDGLGEYGIGDPTAYNLGEIRVHSGASGDAILVTNWLDQNHSFGEEITHVGDLNGDGLPEIGVGATGFDPPALGNAGRVGIYSPQPGIGTAYCGPAVIGSSGRPATIIAYGSRTVSDECFSLTAVGLPIATFGYFIAGTAQANSMPLGSIGIVCIGGANVARFNAPEQIVRGPSGSAEIDLLQIPGNPPRPVMPGETWNFQCWFRDSNPAGNATSNFSSGVSVSFQ
ncbi:MAG: integrin alpha [Planctomycetota bacterium]